VLDHVDEEEVLLAEGIDGRIEREDHQSDPEPEREAPAGRNRRPACGQRAGTT
jgi:hypothetical protein